MCKTCNGPHSKIGISLNESDRIRFVSDYHDRKMSENKRMIDEAETWWSTHVS